MSNRATVLIVDDVPTNIQVLAGFLKKHYQLKVATNGKQALVIIKQQRPDLILLDIDMPEMNGYEVCQTLKDNPETQNIPIIFVTANNQEEDEEKGLQLGAVDYITKPIRPSIVTARVNTQIMLKQQYDQLRNMAIKDQLTDLYNRHYLFEAAHQRIANAIRHNHALSILMLDIDHFKRINDQYGHPTGDAVLVALANLLKKQCRDEDIIARFGGEEFVILLDQT
ncbi:MAG: diguanylate cyclase, partial [Gammaproteobacteria bacterium]|nr:diguanylate cyclase [Gammaproteobacteria bacterium]